MLANTSAVSTASCPAVLLRQEMSHPWGCSADCCCTSFSVFFPSDSGGLILLWNAGNSSSALMPVLSAGAVADLFSFPKSCDTPTLCDLILPNVQYLSAERWAQVGKWHMVQCNSWQLLQLLILTVQTQKVVLRKFMLNYVFKQQIC